MSGRLDPAEFSRLEEKYRAGAATEEDLSALEPYRAKRAILLASGFGSRMLPITLNTPKPLVNVNGRRIVTTILDALLAIDVTEIHIVTGYLKEQFETLKADYPMIRLIENPIYDTTNNISSACAAAGLFSNAYVFESDLVISNPQILKKYHDHSCYLGRPVESTEDWCFETENGVITDLHKGGEDCHLMHGISYWTAEDGERLSEDLQECFEADEDTKQRFWDDVPCVIRAENYRIRIQECEPGDVEEIDSFAELQQIDPRYHIDL